MNSKISPMTPFLFCSSLATTLCALLQYCVLIRSQENHKENEHVENLVFVVAAALRPCDIARLSCSVAHNTVRLPHETQKIVIVEVYGCCTIDVEQVLPGRCVVVGTKFHC